MDENLRAMLAMFGCARPEGETRIWEGMGAVCSAVNFSMFNAAFLTEKVTAVAELDERIARAAAYYAGWRLPWSFWLCDYWVDCSLYSGVQKAFQRRGLHLALEMPGMYAAALKPAARACEDLERRPVADDATRAAFARLMCDVFGIPKEAARQIYASPAFWGGALAGWVAYRDGAPVACAATLAAGVIGVYAVGTLPDSRRRGYGEAVMRHAIARAAEDSGFAGSSLQASQAGFHLYRMMGYQPLARYAVFASAK